MLRTNLRDRGALTALALALLSVVAVVLIENGVSGSASDRATPAGAYLSMITPTDTLAQWIMAFFTVLATAISGWAVVLVRDTLSVNRRATDAAVSAVQVAEDSTLKQLRPWVVGHGVAVIEATNFNVAGSVFPEGLALQAMWGNSGQSPAIKARVHTVFSFVPIGAAVPSFPSEPHEGEVIIPNGSIASGVNFPVVGDDLTRFIKREIDVIVFSRVDYRESLNPLAEHYSEATYRCRYNGMKSGVGGVEQVHLDVSPTGPQNTAT
ncbi:hypothetical protein I6F15_00630 [Bradyrhizobium sp. BRP14]|nr:hypothetical protein [Bradyrhizobium sp. BRP14]